MDPFTLPPDFLRNMQALLGKEYDAFLGAYEGERHFGLRINTLKWEKGPADLPFTLEPVPWAKEGFYYREEEHPGRHPLHEAGAYYIQEPSAMSAAAVLDIRPGDRVLDLCAAPGGKSTQIAGRLMGSGLLVSNEIVSKRALILSENIERMGVRNCVVLNESPESLSGRFTGFFDRILVDAPCSGEGMFRKEEASVAEWSLENVGMCADRQARILDSAAPMLRGGGTLVYSTCTFNMLENENNVEAFLLRHPEFEQDGRPLRIFPHTHRGEGHFVAKLRKKGDAAAVRDPEETMGALSFGKDSAGLKKDLCGLFEEMGINSECAAGLFEHSRPEVFGENIYLTPASFPVLKGLRVMRPGLHVAVGKKNRMEPAHSLAMSLRPYEVEMPVELDFETASRYTAGETVPVSESLKGWKTVFTAGASLGLIKAVNGIGKNHYPKGLRK